MRLIIIAMALMFLGGSIAHACGTDTPPAPAIALGYTCEVFAINSFSLNNIDVNDTGSCVSSPCLYTHNKFPNTPCGNVNCNAPPACSGCIWAFGTQSATPSGDYSIDGSNRLVMAPVSNTPYGPMPQMFNTCRDNGSGGFIGQTFSGGFYAVWNVPQANTNRNSEPSDIIWFVPTEFLTGGSGGTSDFYELDFPEWPFFQNYTHWVISGVNPTTYDFQSFGSIPVPGNGTADYSLVLPAANAGVGQYRNYVSGTQVSSINLPGGAPGFTQHNCLLLGAGANGQTQTIASLRIFQAPATGNPPMGGLAANDNQPLVFGEKRRVAAR